MSQEIEMAAKMHSNKEEKYIKQGNRRNTKQGVGTCYS